MKRLATILLLMAAAAALTAAVFISPRVGHPVTPWMAESAVAANGRVVLLPEMTSDRPSIVVFILPGCPCSEAYEPYTHELFRGYGTQVNMIGIVAGNLEEANIWQRDHNTPFPVMADPDRSIARSFAAERSAYTALITDGQTVNRLWPGYSAEMLREVSRLTSLAVQTKDVSLDFQDAPGPLTSGCRLD